MVEWKKDPLSTVYCLENKWNSNNTYIHLCFLIYRIKGTDVRLICIAALQWLYSIAKFLSGFIPERKEMLVFDILCIAVVIIEREGGRK